MIEVGTRGVGRAMSFFTKLTNQGPEIENKVSTQIAKEIQKSARLRAPMITGTLKECIVTRVTKKGKVIITVKPPAGGPFGYAAAQEFGYTPHMIPWEYFDIHFRVPGMKIDWFASPKGFSRVKAYKPFIRPAMAATYPHMKPIAIKIVKEAIRRSR